MAKRRNNSPYPNRRLTITDPGWWDAEYRVWFRSNVALGPRTPIELAKIRRRWDKIMKRRRREQRRAARAALEAKQKASSFNRTRKVGQRRMDRLILAMEPGAWYDVGELDALGLMPRNSLNSILHQKCRDHGVLEKARNADWNGRTDARRNAGFLFRLSARGERLRGLLALLE